MNERIKELKVEIVHAQMVLAKLQAEEQSILRLAESNVFESLKDADIAMYCILENRASEDCEGSYNCGNDEYTQEFMIGTQKYLATMTFEYNRHDKRFYYIDSSHYNSKEIVRMTPKEYLQSLIAGQESGSSIPVHLSELKFLMVLIEVNEK